MHDEPARERARAMVSPASGEIVFTVPGNGPPVAVAPAYTELNRPLRPWTIGVVARSRHCARDSHCTRGLRRDARCSQERCTGLTAPAVRVEDRDLERDVGRHFHAHRAIGLDRCVADDLAHHARGTERGVVRIGDVVVVRNRHRLLDAHEARLAIGVLRERGIRNVGDAGGGAAVRCAPGRRP